MLKDRGSGLGTRGSAPGSCSRAHHRHHMLRSATLLLLGLSVVAIAAQKQPPSNAMTGLAERYVQTVLALGQHDADYVDAFYGPAAWKEAASKTKIDLDTIATRAAGLRKELAAIPAGSTELERLRHQYLDRQLASLEARVRMLKGERLSFDEESRALYDAVAPTLPESHFQAILDKLEKRFPGRGLARRPLRRAGASRSSFRPRSWTRFSGPPSTPAASARSSTSSCRPARASRSRTSPASHGAATTGIRGTTAA